MTVRVEAMVVDRDVEQLPTGAAEVWIRTLYDDGDIERSSWPGKTRRLPAVIAAQLPEWASPLRSVWSVAYHPDFLAYDHSREPGEHFDHEDWYVFRAMDLAN